MITDYDLNKSIKNLKEKFNEVKNMGYVKGIKQKSQGNSGLTFEKLIGKENDNFQIADYDGIEIKVKNNFGYRYLQLFSLVPSNSFGIELKRLRNTYGKYDNDFKNIKTLNKSVFANKMSFIDTGFWMQLKIKYSEKRIYLLIYDRNGHLFEKNVYWDFDEIINMVNRKLKMLAIVKYRKKAIENTNYFRYEKINFYKLKNINTFFNLIEEGLIRIYICLSVYKSGPKIGTEHDHGVVFGIKEYDLLKLYDEYDV